MTPSGNKPDKPDKGDSKKKPASTLKDKKTKEKKPKSSHKRGTGFREEEINHKYNKPLPRSYSERSAETLKCKFGALKNAPKPTGDPNCPPVVLRAKRIQREIESHSGAINLDDDNDHDDLGDNTTHEDEDQEDDEKDSDDHGQEGSLHPEQDKDGGSGDELNEAATDGE
ncbi:hypothetical protein BDK51DRAFT_27243, partial [Blyttiomyces helicus]